jgi:hypothetical protein
MPRSLADPLFERLLRSFPPDQAYARTDWTDDTMPAPVAHFLGQLLAHHSRREARRLRRARTDWVDYDHPEVEQAVRTFFDAVEAHTQVPAGEWKKTLRQATHHSTAHLVRPVSVLADFVFGDREKALRLPEVLRRMDFFGPYDYLRKAVRAFAEKKNLSAVPPDRFETFLYRIDQRVTEDFGTDRWLRLLDPLFGVARRATDRERLSVDLLQTFFAEKGATAIKRRLSRYEADGHDEVGPKALYRLIDEAGTRPAPTKETPDETPSPDRRSSEAPPDPPSTPTDAPDDEEIWGVAGTARPEGTEEEAPPASEGDGSTPLWKQFQQGRTPSPKTSEGSPSGNDASDGEQPLWARFRGGQDERVSDAVADEAAADGEPARAASDGASTNASSGGGNEALDALEREILGTTNPPHRSVYVRQLFNGDQTAYRQVLRRLRSADSWGEASQIIASDVFRAHKVNIYSDAAVHFTNAVESRFRE